MSDSERLLIRIVGDDSAPAELPRAGVLAIGSSKERAAFVVEGQGVADVHCAIGILKGGGWAVKDMGSEYGTLLNGKKVKSSRVKLGDVLLLGSKRLTIVSSEQLAATPAPEPNPAPAEEAEPKKTQKEKLIAQLGETSRAPTLGGYRVERTLGRGGMGKVFLAVQESLDRQVALKVMAPHLAEDAEFVRRFQAEARAAASLTHPNVVIVHDVGEQKNYHYLSMEYMDRGSCEELLAERGRLSYREVLEVLRDAAGGLVYAESRGIVHRDIKPANLMRNHQGATKIADLGLAVQVEAESELESEGGKKVFGTPHFISPEQLRGETVDCRSDLYSLGATIYQLLTGETPFGGETTRDILRGHLFEPAPRVRERITEVPKEFDALIARLLEKDPADRYPSAAALLADTQRLLAQEVGSAAGTSPNSGSSKLVPIAVLVIALVGAGLFFGGVFDGDSTTPTPPSDDPPIVADTNDLETNITEPEVASVIDAQPPIDTDPGTSTEVTDETEPDDRDLRIFELEAEGKFLRLAQEDLTKASRIERLRSLAAEYAGTDSARVALEQATALETASTQESERLTELDAQKSQLFSALKRAANLEAEPPTPSAALEALDAVVFPETFSDNPSLLAERARLRGLIIERALEFAANKDAAATAAGQTGDRENFLAHLAAIVNTLDVPVQEGVEESEELIGLRAARSSAQQRMQRVDETLGQYAKESASAATLQMATAFGGAQGLERELQQLDLAAAKNRLDAALNEAQSDATRLPMKQLRDDCIAAQAALEHIGGSFSSWRRKTIDDPRTGKPITATGANALGVQVGGETLTWSAFGGNSGALSSLFAGRLSGEYSAQQERGIIALLRITAALEVVADASEMFFPDQGAQFTAGEARELTAKYETLFSWLDQGSAVELKAAIVREREAAELLGATLRASDEAEWAKAVAGLERLLAEYSNTLIVLLMSDGTS